MMMMITPIEKPSSPPTEEETTTTSADSAVGGGGGGGVKRGHMFCGCCCDVRRACIIINIISLCSTVFSIIFFLILGTGDSNLGVGFLVLMLFGLGFILAGLYGAIKFQWMMVCAALVYYVFSFILNLILLNWVRFIMDGIFVYPHIFLVMELRNDIMTKENLPVEDKCCTPTSV
jgi:hypothetical protein